MATEEFQSPLHHKNVVHRDIIISPGFRSVAAMAGWDEEALLAASQVVEDTPERESSKSQKRTNLASKSPKRRIQRCSPVTNPALVLNLDDDYVQARVTRHDGPVAGKEPQIESLKEERKQENTEPKSDEMPLANLPCMNKLREELSCAVIGNLKPQIESLKEKRKQAEPKSEEMPPANLPYMDKLREELSCAICLEICFEPSTTPCGHSFCKKCLKSAADKCGKKCPKCRQLIGNGRSCIVNTSLWNTIQLLFPQEVEARKAVAAKNSREEVKDQSSVGEDSISTSPMMTNPSNIRVSSSSRNQSGRSNFMGMNRVDSRRARPSQAEDAALALRLQREDFMVAFRAADENQTQVPAEAASTGRANLRAMASRAVPRFIISVVEPTLFFSSRPVSELDAVVKLQKAYKSYWTGRNLADCAAVAEELWLALVQSQKTSVATLVEAIDPRHSYGSTTYISSMILGSRLRAVSHFCTDREGSL
ncbi:hypothetical protein MKX03_029378 [Papaver bracteatum]|nr:hypothetical protein MKX03_029378 [Papaver bracteatum]